MQNATISHTNYNALPTQIQDSIFQHQDQESNESN